MSDSSETSWSSAPNAPQVPYPVHFEERAGLAGDFFGIILYGILVSLFFLCMRALFNPINRTTGRAKWGLVVHTTLMFSIVTVATSVGLQLQSISYIDNREFPGGGELPPGPIGYKYVVGSEPIYIIPNTMFQINQWLADGLLLYRCYLIYSMNFWVVAFPCLMYLSTFVLAVLCNIQDMHPYSSVRGLNIAMPYFSISLSLNVILTLMIVGRVFLHSRNLQKATGNASTVSGIYDTLVTMLVESCALYTIAFLLFMVPWFSGSLLSATFWPALTETQVIAPFLIVLRVASRRALTSNGTRTTSETIHSMRFRDTYEE